MGAQFTVVQHGLLAHQAPPLPQGAHLMAFTAEDARWWTAGRSDLTAGVVGSQLLWEAQQPRTDAERASAGGTGADAEPVDEETPGVFLGQLHGAELPRREFARAAEQYCRNTGAAYRPHPAERDKLSRLMHAVWRRRGIRVEDGTTPVGHGRGPVAAVFSTGVLEAAHAGRPAWVVHPDPPRWLTEFWDRYGMSRWLPGTSPEPTRPLEMPAGEPAAAIAAALFGTVPLRTDAKGPADVDGQGAEEGGRP